MGLLEFIEAASEARRIALSFANPLIVHHYDADGISSGAIVKAAFQNENRAHRIIGIKKVDDVAIEMLKNEKEIIFVDLGNNEKVSELKDVLIIDHHQVKETGKPQINPLLHGLDGGSELSASGTAHFVFGICADLGLVGALGDMEYPLQGANTVLCQRGIDSGEIRKGMELRFYGRFSRPLPQFLAYSEEPPVPGIAYNEDRARKLLEDLGIENMENGRPRYYADLKMEEKTRIISAIAELFSNSGRIAPELVGEVYDLPKRPVGSMLYDAHEFSTVLNACGRHGKPELGIAVCLGDSGAYLEAASFISLHRRMIRDGVLFGKQNVADLGPFLFLDGREAIDEGIIGIVCGMLLQGARKPIMGISSGENRTIKVSCRTGKKTGINLASAISATVAKTGGAGGGHAVAAGANIPEGALNEFMRELGISFYTSLS